MNTTVKVALLAFGIGVTGIASAERVIYDFTGTGAVCTYDGDGSSSVCVDGTHASGTVTLYVNSAGPTGSDSGTDGSTFAYDLSGWVKMSMVINWASNSYTSGPVAGETYSDAMTEVMNDENEDRLFARFLSQTDGQTAYNYSFLFRASSDTSWLTGLGFVAALELAPAGTNWIGWQDWTERGRNRFGTSGDIFLTSLKARTAPPVPEPSALLMLAAGSLLMCGQVRRAAVSRQ